MRSIRRVASRLYMCIEESRLSKYVVDMKSVRCVRWYAQEKRSRSRA